MANEVPTPEQEAHLHPKPKTYLWVWFWLFIITLVEITIAFMPIPKLLMAQFFIILALMKAGLIAGFFMHLIYERINLIYSILLPLILLAALVAAILPDAWSILLSRAGY